MRKQRPLRADTHGRLRETRHGTKHFVTWQPIKPQVITETGESGRGAHPAPHARRRKARS